MRIRMKSDPEAKRTFGSALDPNATSQVRGPFVIVPLESRPGAGNLRRRILLWQCWPRRLMSSPGNMVHAPG